MDVTYFTLTQSDSIAYSIPSLALGGILADVMGLGKTLTMISAIVCSRAQAAEYAKSQQGNEPLAQRTRATLIVVTSMR
jgi:SNF2 family DNA or RNA helicase